jgi:hypothetical protein
MSATASPAMRDADGMRPADPLAQDERREDRRRHRVE